eukprot:CAMPEP_0117071820 /NCGR_PEP_ID=MMETSP0472-20121206/50511_1 /TAXON_ID=693140 ORGANISM="Tiarina fusus, Strain LIS" /NCGR_SAMPLE_ID=MMETSP0472 /ASSEMBLY_ACC=CAM_ASM_000603 /LENGTH=46 /DNA_ID= /DNA_START= /DNA_END= /DNA_ORIENTATION=
MKLVDDEEDSEKSFRFLTKKDSKDGGDDEGSSKILYQKNELDVSLR